MKKLIGVFLILIILIFGSWLYLFKKYMPTTPSKTSAYYLEHFLRPHAKMKKESIGFMPYWRIDDIIKYTRLDLITEVNYFGLYINKDGEFIKTINGEMNPGKREWESQEVKDYITRTHILGAKFTLSIICQYNNDIESILDSEKAQNKLISATINEVKSRNLDGINVDFEYLGTPDPGYSQKFSEFSKKLKRELKKQNSVARLEVSIQPQSIRTPDVIDLKQISESYDYFIGMSYDFSGGSAKTAGPIAPMTGYKEDKYFYDVTAMYEGMNKHIPKEKILMGVPHYGWDWAVQDGKTIQSTTLLQDDPENYSAVISYARAREDKNLIKSQCKFDDYAKEPWCWYTDKKTKIDHQVWFEDNKSIGIKYDFANKQDFGGVAIWVLGYEKNYPDVWNMLKDKFSTSDKN